MYCKREKKYGNILHLQDVGGPSVHHHQSHIGRKRRRQWDSHGGDHKDDLIMHERGREKNRRLKFLSEELFRIDGFFCRRIQLYTHTSATVLTMVPHKSATSIAAPGRRSSTRPMSCMHGAGDRLRAVSVSGEFYILHL